MEEIKVEQKDVDKLIKDIKETNAGLIKSFELGEANYYNTKIPWDEQKDYQMTHDLFKNDVTKIRNIANNPYFGRIKILSEDGDLGDKADFIGTYGIKYDKGQIYDYRSETGKFYMKVVRNLQQAINSKNIMELRKVFIEDSIVKKVTSLVDINSSEAYVPDNEEIERNKEIKDIISTLDAEQYKTTIDNFDQNIIIQGVPGSGKTMLGAFRLSQVNFEDMQKENRTIYITSSETLKKFTIENTKAIDTSRIEFRTKQDIYNLAGYLNRDGSTSILQVRNKRNGLRGKIDNEEDKSIFRDFNNIESRNKTIEYVLPEGIKDYTKAKSLSQYQHQYQGNMAELISISNPKLFNEFITYKLTKKEFDELNKKDIKGYKGDSKYISQMEKIIRKYDSFNLKFVDKHISMIFIDEAQDYTRQDIKLLKLFYPNAKFTLCGDVNQSNGVIQTQDDWNILAEELDAEVVELNRCYRSSREVVRIMNNYRTNKIYKEAITSSDIKGSFVKIKVKENEYIDKIKDLMAENSFNKEETIIITLNSDIYSRVYHSLSDITVISSDHVKGLESKNVILLRKGSFDKTDKKLLYMLSSRAKENLVSIEIG